MLVGFGHCLGDQSSKLALGGSCSFQTAGEDYVFRHNVAYGVSAGLKVAGISSTTYTSTVNSIGAPDYTANNYEFSQFTYVLPIANRNSEVVNSGIAPKRQTVPPAPLDATAPRNRVPGRHSLIGEGNARVIFGGQGGLRERTTSRSRGLDGTGSLRSGCLSGASQQSAPTGWNLKRRSVCGTAPTPPKRRRRAALASPLVQKRTT